ncbi:MAG: hypothetical protein ABR972_14715, partial [Acidimicrobiales bacterium]
FARFRRATSNTGGSRRRADGADLRLVTRRTRRVNPAESGAAFPSTGAGARALFCTLAGLTYRQLCGLVQRPSETGAVIAHIGRCWSGDKANSGTIHDPELFRREILPRLGTVPLAEIIAAAGCSKASASDIRRGKWKPHVSTWRALAELVGALLPESAGSRWRA